MWLFTGLTIPKKLNALTIMHVPLVKTEALDFDVDKALFDANSCDAMIISSQQTILHLSQFLLKLRPGLKVYVSGDSTKKALETVYSGIVKTGITQDQEGMLKEILKDRPGSIFYPHASSIRPYLLQNLMENKILVIEIECYKTKFIEVKQHVPEEISGYIFSSSSNVHAFKKNFGNPQKLPLLVAGHVTKKTVLDVFGCEYESFISCYL